MEYCLVYICIVYDLLLVYHLFDVNHQLYGRNASIGVRVISSGGVTAVVLTLITVLINRRAKAKLSGSVDQVLGLLRLLLRVVSLVENVVVVVGIVRT